MRADFLLKKYIFFIIALVGLHTTLFGFATVSFNAGATSTQTESAGTVTFDLTVTGYDGDFNIAVTKLNASTASSIDASSPSTSSISVTGNGTYSFNVTIYQDTRYEESEDYEVQITGIFTGNGDSHTMTITDDDAAPVMQFSASSGTDTEDTGTHVITVSLDAASERSTLPAFTISIDATSTMVVGDDYSSLSPTTYSFSSGSTTKQFSISITDDAMHEDSETIVFNITTNDVQYATLGDNIQYTLTVSDNDDVPTIQFNSSSSSASEGNSGTSSKTVAVDLSAASGVDASCSYSVSGTSAGQGQDHDLGSGTVTISASNLSANISFNLTGDTSYENDETIIVTFSSPTNCSIGTTDEHIYTITNDDSPPTIEFQDASTTDSEATTSNNITVKITGTTELSSSVDYAITGTATGGGVDYTLSAGTVTLTAGNNTTENIPITIINDELYENQETVILTISNPTNSTLGTQLTHTYYITNDDSQPSIGFSATSSNESESNTNVDITILLDPISGLASTVDYAIAGTGTADEGAGNDYIFTPNTATIAAGQNSTTISFTVNNDGTDETDETIDFVLSNPTNASLGTSAHTYTINDNDDAPSVGFASSGTSGSEASTSVLIPVILSVSSELTVTIDYSVSGSSTAMGDGVDYTLANANGTLTFTAGDTLENISLTIVNDSKYENSESIVIFLSGASNATLGGISEYAYTITNDDNKPSVGFSSATGSGYEDAPPASIGVELTAVSGLDVTVDYSVTGGTALGGGSDYTLLNGTFSIPAGDLSATTSISFVNDQADEDSETIVVLLSNVSSSTATINASADEFTYTIYDDDDPPSIGFSSSTASTTETDANVNVNIPVILSNRSGKDIGFSYSATDNEAEGSGTDYTFVSGSDTFSAGDSLINLVVNITGDVIDESAESFDVVLVRDDANSQEGTMSITVTINDNDPTPTISFNQLSKSSPESTANPTIGLSITAVSGLDISVNYVVAGIEATSEDYTLASGTLNILAGTTTANIVPTIIDDYLVEDDESFTVTLSDGTNNNVQLPGLASREHEFTITDDDSPPADFTVGAVTTVGGNVVTGYWNNSNTSFTVVVPIANDDNLVGGKVYLLAKNATTSFDTIGTAYSIQSGDKGSTITLSVSEAQFASHEAYADGKEISINAIIRDQYSNSTTGTQSSNTLTIDITDPADFQVGTVTVLGSPVYTGYWNSLNTGLNVAIPIADDASLGNGEVIIRGRVGTVGSWTDLDSAQITIGQINSNISIPINRSQLEGITGFSDNPGANLYITTRMRDVAGNSKVGTQSATSIILDEEAPTITSVASNQSNSETVYLNAGDQIEIHVVTTESVTKSVTGTPTLALNPTGSPTAYYSSGSGSTTLVFSYTVGSGENIGDLDYSTVNSLGLGAATLRDIAGNDLVLTLPGVGGAGSLGGDYDIVVDTQQPDGVISYTNNPANQIDDTYLSVDLSEIMANASVYIAYAGGTILDTTALTGTDSTWSADIDVPSGNDGQATISITGEDLAGNSISSIVGPALWVDNTSPVLTSIVPDSNSYVNNTVVSYNLSETVESGTVTYANGSDALSPHVINLTAGQLVNGTHTDVDLSSQLSDPLEDGLPYTMTWVVTDSAGNQNTQTVESPINYDISSPSVTITYSDTLVNGGTTILYTATFDEAVQSGPTITIDYSGGGGLPEVAGADMDSVSGTVWTYEHVAPTGAGNTGPVSVTVSASDLAGNALDPANVADGDLLTIDNIAPSATFTYANADNPALVNKGKGGQDIQVTAIFSERMRIPTLTIEFADSVYSTIINNGTPPVNDSIWVFDVTLPTGTENSGFIVVSTDSTDLAGNAIADFTDQNIFKVDNDPPAAFTTGNVTPEALNPVTGWINSTTDSLRISVPAPSALTDSTIIGGGIFMQMNNITRGTGYVTIGDTNSIETGGTNTVFRLSGDIVSGTLLQAGDTLRIRAALLDNVENVTFGGPSSQTYTYDITAPTFTSLLEVFDTTLISSDAISSDWGDSYSEPANESGVSYYEYAMDIAADNDTSGFVDWINVGASTAVDTVYPLRHNTTYRMFTRATDNAGNTSTANLLQKQYTRVNSEPVITLLDSTGWFEDIAFSDTLDISDSDFATLLNDTIALTATTTRLIGQNAVSQMSVDSESRILSWTPTQEDTGKYEIEVIAADMNDLRDTITFTFTVEPVNDAPVLAFPDSIRLIEFDEDRPTSDSIFIRQLTDFATDVDNPLSSLSWQVVILPDTSTFPGFPTSNVIIGPGTPPVMRTFLRNKYNRQYPKANIKRDSKLIISVDNTREYNDSLNVDLLTVGDTTTWAHIYADSNYYTLSNRDVIFYVTDDEGLFDTSAVQIRINPENDPPTWSDIPMQTVNENDTLRLDLADFVTDVDDESLSFTVSALTNSDKMVIPIADFTSSGLGDTTLFIPEQLWSDSARIQVIANDGNKADTAKFTIDVLFVPRPAISMWVVQNNAFSNYYKVFLTDSAQKTTNIELRIQNVPVIVDTIGNYTYVSNYNFGSAGTYNFNIIATGTVGATDTTYSIGLTLARSRETWRGSSNDGKILIEGKPGAVRFDQSLVIADSTVFDPAFYDRASYLIGDESMSFNDPVILSWRSKAKNLAIYRRNLGVSWQELPTFESDDGLLSAYTDRMGYYRLGQKTIFVPGKTSLNHNYPNPFNPYTNIEFDIGFLDGPRQKATINMYNIRGQHIATLFNDFITIGRHTIRWDSKDDFGTQVASGIYFVQLTTDHGISKSRKLLLVR